MQKKSNSHLPALKTVALTGGIGSGKSVVARMFEDLGVPLYYADQRAKQLMTDSAELRQELKDLFGEQAFQGDTLNRGYIASVVFGDPAKLQALNALVHPRVERDYKHWLAEQAAPYVVQEIPLLFENQKQSHYDVVITVTAPEEIRIKRVMRRDQVTREQVIQRMKSQLPEQQKTEGATFVIENLDLEQTRARVQEIHRQLLAEIP